MYDRSGQRKYLNDKERRAFFCSLQKENSIKNRAFCLTLLYSGCRISEALDLKWNQVDFSEEIIAIRTLKCRKPDAFRLIPIPSSLLDLYSQMDRESDSLWSISRTTAWRLVKSQMTKSGISGANACPKGLRHGFAISYLSKNVPITMIKKWLGHRSLKTTAMYLNATGCEERFFARKGWELS